MRVPRQSEWNVTCSPVYFTRNSNYRSVIRLGQVFWQVNIPQIFVLVNGSIVAEHDRYDRS